MRPAPSPEGSPFAPWSRLREALAGSFAARARGLLASEFILLNQGGEEFGRLRIDGPEGGELEAGDLRAVIERVPRSGHKMLTGGAQTLVAQPVGSSDTLEIRCGDRRYEARLSLLRNTAVARVPDGGEAARVTGGLTNRSYEAVFDTEDDGSLPAAVFLLYHTVALRRRVYRAGATGS
jgi:hypothetical protein